ncbi:proteasome-interacting thioredoxin protein [Niveomyces insectorum RCEF 264]|uniref:Proteasome-interacting thioredoxin protein n=1 Tax=Niveomyces insectorum RCEF 264 TaxID=1081102 RepID=A0A167UWI6_9HYPO|nr:proteasome-interacting thioredoxin protein [Niveomyces insectorum RCEF 264]
MASKVVQITSAAQFDEVLKSSKVVVADFFATWCAPCHAIAPVFESIATQLARDRAVTFVKIDTDAQKAIAQAYRVTSLPTFVLFRDGAVLDRVQGADPKRLEALVTKLAQEAGAAGAAGASGASDGGAGGETWHGASLPRGYVDLTGHVEVPRCELLNVDAEAGGNSIVKLHTLQITSHPTDEAARPHVIKLFSNSPHNLGFDEAEDTLATQELTLSPADWNDAGTASVSLRFVKFQNINSLVVFVVSAEDGADKVRIDRLRLVGEAGEKRDMGKLEKIGDEPGE